MATRRIDPQTFYGAPAPPPRTSRLDPATFYGHTPRTRRSEFFHRTAASPTRLGAVLLGLGFYAVFVSQANLLHQLVLGAPVFEEFFKVGLALLVCGALRIRWLVPRVLVGILPGVGFGYLEHWVTYSAESDALLLLRVLFHSGATALSMAAYHVLEALGDVRVRWGLTLPSTVIHLTNNFLALVLGIASLAVPRAEPAAFAISTSLVAMAWTLAIALMLMPGPFRDLVRRRFPDPVPAPPAIPSPAAPQWLPVSPDENAPPKRKARPKKPKRAAEAAKRSAARKRPTGPSSGRRHPKSR